MKCSSGKTGYDSRELAEEALIQNHIRNVHRKGAGPQNVYECHDCGDWHFTSRLPTSLILLNEEVIKRIAQEQLAMSWKRRFR